MSAKRIIEARDIVKDIRSGMSDAELMQKYGLSVKGLQSAFQKLVDNRILSVEEVYGQRSSSHDTVIINDMRSLPRHFLTVAVAIYEADRPEIRGKLRDVTERGLGITGIEARIGEIKTLVIPCRELLDVDHIWLEAECRWTDPKESSDEWSAGFQITKISKEGLAHLRDLVRHLVLAF